MRTLLLAATDSATVERLESVLLARGYDVVTALDGRAALERARVVRPAVGVLDSHMRNPDCIEVARRLRAADAVPILLLLTPDMVERGVEHLASSVDDFVVAPFITAELLARIDVLVQRAEGVAVRDTPLTFADLHLDPATGEAWRRQRHFTLTARETDLLAHLMRQARRVVTREAILEEVWGYDFGGQGKVLGVYIGYLRAKTEAGGEPRLIQTVHGVGYVLREEE
ncbi:MAG: response regulator transcription factor [Anaerolineae bacterium]